MSYPMHTKAIISYIEAHVKEGRINLTKLEERMGFSQAYIRDFFREHTGYPIATYARIRRVKRSAAELINTNKTILDISYEFGFSNPETYTRAFRAILGVTPSEFRKLQPMVGKKELFEGIYSIDVIDKKEQRSDITERNRISKGNESTILYGVPKVNIGVYGGHTLYSICLKACAEYLGEDINYSFVMATSAAAFRFVWNNHVWDLSNIDIYHTFEENNQIYQIGPRALGREFYFLSREKNTRKEEFIEFIKEHIDEGYPCIALGIIGPPEPCIITGYRKGGKELLGWNFFQNDPEFASSVEIDESGYFICRNWWENTDTQAVMCMGAIVDKRATEKLVITNAIRALEGRIDGCYSKGVKAYDAWAKALQDIIGYGYSNNYSNLFEKYLCQQDAMSSLIDGRGNAASYFSHLASEKSANSALYKAIVKHFSSCAQEITTMHKLFETDANEGVKRLTDPLVLRRCYILINNAKKEDEEALRLLKSYLSKIS